MVGWKGNKKGKKCLSVSCHSGIKNAPDANQANGSWLTKPSGRILVEAMAIRRFSLWLMVFALIMGRLSTSAHAQMQPDILPSAPSAAADTAPAPSTLPAAPTSAVDKPTAEASTEPKPGRSKAASALEQPTVPLDDKSQDQGHGQNQLMPVPPPPVNTRLDNAVRSEAERAYYDQRRKRYMDTFDKAYEGLVPLGPNEVRETMGRYERTQKAAQPPAAGQPRGEVRIKTLALEPGSEAPTVNISAGYVTTITILDATGEPWPIMDLGIGGNFEVSKTGAGNHVVRIMPLTRYGYGNLSVLLQDLSTPIIFKLASGGPTVDYRFDARIPRLGPNAKLSLIEKKTLSAGSGLIMSFLDNAPPGEAKRVRISGADARTMAWTMNDRMFVRTPLTMLSPSWEASVSSADGTTVYELNDTPALILSDNGTIVRARVTPKEQD